MRLRVYVHRAYNTPRGELGSVHYHSTKVDLDAA